ncbi:MAG: S-layer homology domain-containing protein [Oscillospiraceae bacterium]|nr:S-layer homology domain-containing protein [Oscillospiraceae bacterium]
MKRIVSALICVILLACMSVPAAAYNDVWPYLQTSHYCQVLSMSGNRELFRAAERYGPGAALTKGMTAQILYGFEGKDNGYRKTFSDVAEDSEYALCAAWAVKSRIFSAEDGYFHPEQAMTRETLGNALKAYMDHAGMLLPQINERYYFYDAAMMSVDSQETAATLQRGGVIIEAPDGNYYPFNNVTVAEGEEILLRFFGGMRRKFMTMPVATVSEGEEMDSAWFDDACFIGHSQVVGLRDYANLYGMDYYAVIGHKVQDVLNERWYIMPTRRRGTLKNALSAGKDYGKIFIMLGVNDCTDREKRVAEFREPMRQLMSIVRETQPDATVYIVSLAPVGRETKNNFWFNPDNVILYSQVLKDISREFDAEYIDVFRFMCDEQGYMLDEFNAGDGIHLKGTMYSVLADYLKTHTYV